MASKLERLLKKHLISDSALARAAEVHERTVKNAKNGLHEPRMETKRALLDGLNKLLKKRGEKPVGTWVFN